MNGEKSTKTPFLDNICSNASYFLFLMYLILKANKWPTHYVLFVMFTISGKNYTSGRGAFLIRFIPNISKIQHNVDGGVLVRFRKLKGRERKRQDQQL